MKKKISHILILIIIFFLGINIVEADTKEIAVTFKSGDYAAFSDVNLTLTTNEVNGYVTLPEFTDTVTIAESSCIKKVDTETCYFDDSGYSYTFTGWKIQDSDNYTPSITVFQPGDVINYDTLNINADGTLTLEAIWGRVIYVSNEYSGRYYTDYWLYDKDTTTEKYTEGTYSKTGAWNYTYENNTLTLNKGFDVDNPISSLDFAYYIMNYDKIEDYANAYLNVVMLTGDLDYIKGSSGSNEEENYFTTYETYSNTFTDNRDTLSVEDSSYDDTINYIWGDYTAQKNIFGYIGSSNSKAIGVTFKSVGDVNYNLYWDGYGYADGIYGSIRFDNINFGGAPNTTAKRPKETNTVSVSSETAFYGGKGHYIEFTRRNAKTVGGTYVFRPNLIETVIVNGNRFTSWQTSWTSTIKNLDYSINWYLGGSAIINGDINLGTATSYDTATNYTNAEINFTMTGGTANGNIYGGSNGRRNNDLKDRIINIIGDGSTSTTTNPQINGSVYGGGKSGTLTGNTYINIFGSTNIKGSVYGGGYLFSATLYGNSNINIENSEIGGNVFGGGYNGNIEESDDGTGGYINLSILNSKITGDIFGVGMGGTQSTTSGVTVGASESIYDWRNQPFSPPSSFFDSVKNSYYGDYNTDWSWNLPATGFPFIVTNEESSEYGYVCSSAIKYISYTSNNTSNLTFGKTRTFNYLSLAYARHDVDIIIDGSTIGTSTNDKGNVYGGGSVAVVYGDVDIEINDSTIYGTVYGGGDGTTKPSNVTLYSPILIENYTPITYTANADNTVTISHTESVNNLTSLGSFTWSNDISLLEKGGIDFDNLLIWSPNTEGLGSVSGSTKLTISNSVLNNDVFGGGNSGIVFENTEVTVTNSSIAGSLYGGGNSANVSGNTIVAIDGTTSINGNVFGGGNSGTIGTESTDKSTTTVKVVGGTINGNVYGGCNTSVVYGTTSVNIGDKAVNDNNLTVNDINIKGTIFGGGEANASGSKDYDFSFISVTNGTNIIINGEGHNTFNLSSSVFGSGNASSTSGTSVITIKNYGTKDNVKNNISIQRANDVILDNSFIELSGTIDSTNKFASEIFTISRINNFIIKNNSHIYLQNGTNLLQKWTSYDNTDTKATATSDNRIYIYEGKNMKITTSEDASSFGEVVGITKMGIYKNENDVKILGIYDFDNPDNSHTFSSGVYILGAISAEVDVDGFKTNYLNSDNIDLNTVIPLSSGLSHVWQIGSNAKEINVTLNASTYATLGKYTLVDLLASEPATEYSIYDIDYSNLANGVKIIDSSEIYKNYDNVEDANNNLGLTVKVNTNNGWSTSGSFNLLSTESQGYSGDDNFITDYTVQTPSIEIYLENAVNFTRTDTFGTIVLSLYGMKQISELERTIYEIKINITINPVQVSSDGYEAGITTGYEYNVFGTTSAIINQHSSISAIYTLTREEDIFNGSTDLNRVLVSDYVMPENTKLLLIDLSDKNNPIEYYYMVSAEDVTNNKSTYLLSDFIRIGTIDKSDTYDNMKNYYENGIYNEQFIVIIDFKNTTTNTYDEEHSILLELYDNTNGTTTKVNNETINNIKYTVMVGDTNYSLENTTLTNNNIRASESLEVNVTANIDATTYVDTTLEDQEMDLKISLYKDDIKVSGTDLLDKMLTIENAIYYPNIDGDYHVKLNDNVVNVYKKINIDNSVIPLNSGNYKIKLELINSYTGKNNGEILSTKEITFTVKDEAYGLKVSLDNESKIYKQSTGINLAGDTNTIFTIKSTSNLENPNIRLKIYKKTESDYLLTSATDVFSNSLTTTEDKEYLINDNYTEDFTFSVSFIEDIGKGSYKFVFLLYDENTYIGEYPIQILVVD